MKKILAAMMILCVLLAVSALAGAAEKWGVVYNPDPADRLNLRAKPDSGSSSRGKYYTGVLVELLGKEEDGWYPVRIGAMEGYMSAEFIVVGDETEEIEPAMPTVSVRSANGVTLYATSGFSGPSKEKYPDGSKALVYGVGGRWLHVRMEDGAEGFISDDQTLPRITFSSAKADVIAWQNKAVLHHTKAGNKVSLYVGPDTQTGVLLRFYSGVVAELVSAEQNGWYEVSIDGMEGYVQSRYLVAGSDSIAKELDETRLAVLTEDTDLYEEMSRSSDTIEELDEDDLVRVYGGTGRWLYVSTESGDMGFVREESVSYDVPVQPEEEDGEG